MQSEGSTNDRSALRHASHERVTNASSTRGRQVAHCVIATILKLSYVLFLDFFKAFDTVEHRFLLEAPHFLGF